MTTEQTKAIGEIEKSLALTQKELDLERRENEINNRIIQVKRYGNRFSQSQFRSDERGERSGVEISRDRKAKIKLATSGIAGGSSFHHWPSDGKIALVFIHPPYRVEWAA
jgi:hypothetical protein